MIQTKKRKEFVAKDVITITKAMKRVVIALGKPVTRKTIIDWSQAYGFGIKVGGRWYIDSEDFNRFLTEGVK